MTILGAFVGAVVFIVVVGAAAMIKPTPQTLASATPKTAIEPGENFSRPSKQLIMEYESLPAIHRTFGDFRSILRALDVKYTVERANLMFTSRHNSRFNWYNYAHQNDYKDIHNSIQCVKETLARQERALKERAHRDKVDAVAHDLAMVEEWTKNLQTEARIIDEVTKELKA